MALYSVSSAPLDCRVLITMLKSVSGICVPSFMVCKGLTAYGFHIFTVIPLPTSYMLSLPFIGGTMVTYQEGRQRPFCLPRVRMAASSSVILPTNQAVMFFQYE